MKKGIDKIYFTMFSTFGGFIEKLLIIIGITEKISLGFSLSIFLATHRKIHKITVFYPQKKQIEDLIVKFKMLLINKLHVSLISQYLQ